MGTGARPGLKAPNCSKYRAAAGVDRKHDAAEREAVRQISCPVLVGQVSLDRRDHGQALAEPRERGGVAARGADLIRRSDMDPGFWDSRALPDAPASTA
jgi:hypothetical protein